MAEHVESLKLKVDSTEVDKGKKSLDGLNASANKLDQTVANTTKRVVAFGSAIAGLSIGAITIKSVAAADALNRLDGRLKLSTNSMAEFISQQKELYRIATDAHVPLQDITDLFIKIDPALKKMGATTGTVNSLIDTFAKGLKLGGANATESSSAILQFSQAMGSGVLRGDEFNSMMEASPYLMRKMAEGMGVPVGALRDMASNGELTAGRVSAALLKMSSDISGEFSQAYVGMAENMQDLKTEAMLFAQELDKQVGVTSSVSGAIKGLANSFKDGKDEITNTIGVISEYESVLKGVATTLIVMYGAQKAAVIWETALEAIRAKSTITTTSYNAGLMRTVTTTTTLTTAQSFAAIASNVFATALKAIPFIAVASAVAFLATKFFDAKKESDDLQDSLNATAESLGKLTRAQLEYKRTNLSLELQDTGLELRKLRQEYGATANRTSEQQREIDDLTDSYNQLLEASKLVSNAQTQLRNNVKTTTKEVAKIKEQTLEEQIKLLESQLSGKKDKKAERAEKKAREQLEKERISALEGYAELQANQALEDYNNKLHYLDAYADLEAQKAIDQFNIEQGYLTDLAEQQARFAIDLYDSITPDSQKIIEKYATIFEAMKDMSAEMLNGFAEQMNQELDALKVDSFTIEFDTQSLEKVPKAIAAVSKSMSDLQKADVKYQENKKKYQKGTIEYSKNEESYTRNQITGYSNLAGAMSNMFEEGSKEAQAMQTVQAGLALVEATLAVVHAGTGGDVYTAIPRMIATAAMVGTALSNIGTSFSGGGGSVSMPVENTGTGTVLGDVSAQSESIKNSLEKMADLAKPEFQLTSQMAKSLQSIDNKLGGVSANILKVGGFATGAGGVNVSVPNAVVATVESAIDRTLKILEKSPLNIGGIMSAAFLGSGAGLAQKLIGGMFGGGTSTSTIGAGLQFNPQQLQDAIKSLSGASFQTTLTEKKGGWFSKGSSSVADSFSALDEYTKNQFQLVLKDLYDVTDRSATSLGESVTSLLDNLVINIGRINLMGKTGDQIQAQLEAVFSSIGDNMATTALPLLLPFQKIGEGMFETMTRVASGMEQANYYTDRLGVTFQKINYKDILDKQGEVSGEALKQAIGLFEGVTNGVTDMVNSISGTASDVYTAYLSLDKMRYQLEAITGNFDDLSATMAYGSGGLDELSSGMEAYINNFLSEQEQLAYKTSLMTKEFERIGVAMPTSAEGFKQLVQGIDTSTEAGKDLYGRIIVLSDSFSELASSSDDLKSTLFDNIQKFIDGLNKSLASKDPSVSFYKFTSSFNDMIDAIENGSSNLLDVGNVALNNAQSYLDTVTATATAGRDIEFAKAMLVNKFSGVINAPDVSLNTINTTLNMNNMALINELEALKFELASIKDMTITSTSTQLNTLTTQRAILGTLAG